MPRRIVVLSSLLVAFIPSTALGYLDSGSASLLFQAAAASLFALLFLLKTYWSRLKSLFKRSGSVEPPPQERDSGGRPQGQQ